MRSEAALQAWLIRECVKRQWYVQKTIGVSRNGFPDVLVIVHGTVWFLELKTNTGIPSQVQEREIARIRRAGGNVWILYGKTDCVTWLNAAEKDNHGSTKVY